MRQALRDSVDEVLAKMFFTETMGECDATCCTDGQPADEIAVSLAFQGEPSGVLLLRLTAVAAHQIAADFLGIEEGVVSEIQTSEVIRELSNMVCGSVLSRVESATTFQLGAPQRVPPSLDVTGNLSNISYCVQLSNGRLTVDLGTGRP